MYVTGSEITDNGMASFEIADVDKVRVVFGNVEIFIKGQSEPLRKLGKDICLSALNFDHPNR